MGYCTEQGEWMCVLREAVCACECVRAILCVRVGLKICVCGGGGVEDLCVSVCVCVFVGLKMHVSAPLKGDQVGAIPNCSRRC